MKINYNILRLLSVVFLCHDIRAELLARNMTHATMSHGVRESRIGSLVGIRRFGHHVAVGLDFLLPFMKVATQTKYDEMGRAEPLISINTAAATLTGLLAAGGLVVAKIFRSIGFQASYYGDSHSEKSHEKRFDLEAEENQLMQTLENFKLVYNNATGHKVETNLPLLCDTLMKTFDENDINLPVCLQKALCLTVQSATSNTQGTTATSVEKIIAGLANANWIINTSSLLREAIKAGKSGDGRACAAKYSLCQLDEPNKMLRQLITEYIQFI